MANRGTAIQPGYGIIHRSVMERKTVSIQAKALYALIQSYSGSNGVAWPSIDTLASDLCCTPRSIMNWMKELEDDGLMNVSREEGKCNRYYPLVPEPVKEDSPMNQDSQGGEPAFTGTSEPGFTLRLTGEEKQEDKHRRPRKKRDIVYRVAFDPKDGCFSGIDEQMIKDWIHAYPDIDIPLKIDQLSAWLMANPDRTTPGAQRCIKNYEKFLVNCFSRDQKSSEMRSAS